MPKPQDRVTPLAYESVGAGGSSNSLAPEPADPAEDALVCAGLYLGELGNDASDEAVVLYRESDSMFFEDVSNSGPSRRSLSELVSGAGGVGFSIFNCDGGSVYSNGGDALLKEIA